MKTRTVGLLGLIAAGILLAHAPGHAGVRLTCPPDIWIKPEPPAGYDVIAGTNNVEFKEVQLFFANREAERTRNGYLLYDEMTNLELRCYYAGDTVIARPITMPIQECIRITWGLECE